MDEDIERSVHTSSISNFTGVNSSGLHGIVSVMKDCTGTSTYIYISVP